MCLALCQYKTCLIIIVLFYILKYESVSPPSFLLFKVVFAMLGLLTVHIILGSVYQILQN